MLTCDAVLTAPEPPVFVYHPTPCPGWVQTDSMGQEHYSIPWGNCTGDVRHITVDRDGRGVSDMGGPPMVIDVPGSNGCCKIYVYGSHSQQAIRSMCGGKTDSDRQPKKTVDKANGFAYFPGQ